jgi:hypothetical protein
MKTNGLFLSCLSGVILLNFTNTGLAAGAYADAVLADGPIAYYRFSDVPPVATNSGTLGASANGFYTNGATAGAEAPRPPAFGGFEADNTALQVDGISQFVGTVSGLLNGLTNVTVSGWLRRNGAQNNRTGLWGQNDLIEFGYIDNNTLQLWVDNFTNNPVNVTPNPFPDLQWSYVAFTLNGAQMKVYTNGVLAGTAPLDSPDYGTNSFPFNIGGGGVFDAITNNGNYFNGQIDEVAVFDKALTAEQISAEYFAAGISPQITQQPQGTNVFEGADVILSVSASGTPPLFFQWLDFGTPIPDQTNSTLVFSNITVNQGSTFSVIVSNAFGSVESALVDVIVSPTTPPMITQEPASISRYAGLTAVLSVQATGGSKLQYRWQTVAMGAGSDISGATNSSLVFTNVQPTNAGDYRVIVANAAGMATSVVATITVIIPVPGSYEELIVQCGPLAYWRFNETNGTTAFDYAGGYDGTYLNGATNGTEAPLPPQFPGFEPGNLALQLDGVDDFVQATPSLLNNFSNVTMSGWIRRAGMQRGRTGLFGQDNLIEFGYIDNNTIQAWVDDFDVPVNVTPNPFPDLEWEYLALVVNGDALQMTVYTNGAPAGSAPLATNNYDSLMSTAFFVIGGDAFGNGVSFNGQMDEVSVFSKPLTSDKICALYLRATGKPVILSITSTGNIVLDSKPLGVKHDGLDFGATWLATDIDNNFITRTGVMQFAAAELDQITLAAHPDFNSPTGTITFWMRSAGTVTTDNGDFGAILFDRRSNRGDVIVQADDGTIFVQANGGSGNVNSFNTTNTVSDNLWHNIAYVYDQTGATTIYIDGMVAGSQITSGPWSWDPAQQIELGRSHDSFWRRYDGEMDDFRIYNRILTGAEIMQIVNSDALVDPAALQVRFNFDGPPTGVTIDWLCGTLQCTDALVGNGPGTVWVDVLGAIPPYVVNPLSATNRFYRVKY